MFAQSSSEEEIIVVRNLKSITHRKNSPKYKKKREADKNIQENCYKCNKPLRPTNKFACKCGNSFCMIHRFNDQHNCPYNYKALTIKKLKQENPQVINKKVTEF